MTSSSSGAGPAPRHSPVAVVGAGAVGGCMAAHLSAAGHPVTVCVREPFAELVVRTPGGVLRAEPRVVTDPGQAGDAAWVLLATKAHQTAGAAPWLRALARPGVTVAVLQNGVEHEARVAPYAGEAHVLPVVVECPCTRTAPGRVTQKAPARLVVPATERGEAFARLFEGTDVAVETEADFETARWRKLCLNVAGGAVTALTGRPQGVVRDPEVAWLARELVLECARVARAYGARVDDAIAEQVVDEMRQADPAAGTSMLTDRLAGRPLEADGRNGAVVRLGARHGIDTPLNRAVTALLLALNADPPAHPA